MAPGGRLIGFRGRLFRIDGPGCPLPMPGGTGEPTDVPTGEPNEAPEPAGGKPVRLTIALALRAGLKDISNLLVEAAMNQNKAETRQIRRPDTKYQSLVLLPTPIKPLKGFCC